MSEVMERIVTKILVDDIDDYYEKNMTINVITHEEFIGSRGRRDYINGKRLSIKLERPQLSVEAFANILRELADEIERQDKGV